MTGSQHVTVAVSRDPENAAPIAGSFIGPASAFQGIQVDVTVVQVDRPLPPAPPVPSVTISQPNQQSQTNQQVQQAQQMAQSDSTETPIMDMVIHA